MLCYNTIKFLELYTHTEDGCFMINVQKIIAYIEQHDISEELFMISTGLSKSSLIKAKDSLSADDYLRICNVLGVSPWFFYERELSEDSSKL